MSTALSDLLQRLSQADSLTNLEAAKRAVRKRYQHVQSATSSPSRRSPSDPLLAGIAKLDTLADLQKIMSALDQRFGSLHRETVERLLLLKVGDRVRLSPRAHPKYLCGRTATIAASPTRQRIALTLDDTASVADSYIRDDGTIQVSTASVEALTAGGSPAGEAS